MTDGCIFVTGATGILGSHLLKVLLQETDAQIICLVRAADLEEGRQRLLEPLGHYDRENSLQRDFHRRVEVALGDIAKPGLGLVPDVYARLAQRVDAVIHVAALTDLFLSWRRIEPVNVGGTRNIIEFALATPRKYLCHVSTHTVSGDRSFDSTLVFRESDLDVGQGFENLTYQKSKFIAEQMVRAAREQGLVWNIFRPGQIFGESQTGAYPLVVGSVSGLFYDIFKTVIETRTAFLSNTHFDIVPVDYVSRGIVELGLRQPESYETYHLTNPDIKRYTQVVQILKDLGHPIEQIPQDSYRERLLAGKIMWDGSEYKSATTSAFRWWFKRGIDFQEGGVTDSEKTRKVLAARSLTCPPVDRKLLGTYLQAGTALGYFKREQPRRPVMADRGLQDLETAEVFQ